MPQIFQKKIMSIQKHAKKKKKKENQKLYKIPIKFQVFCHLNYTSKLKKGDLLKEKSDFHLVK